MSCYLCRVQFSMGLSVIKNRTMNLVMEKTQKTITK